MTVNQYQDPKFLRQIQKGQTKILAEFDRICRQLDIPYSVYGGTAIGAVRHQGFIPWDDDTDVCLTRADYERFLEEAPAVMSDEFELHNLHNLDDFPYVYTKMVAKGTKFIHEWAKQSTYELPLALDVFPMDAVAPTKREFNSQARATWFWGRLLYLVGTPRPYLEIHGPLRTLIYAATTVIHHTLKLMHISQRWIQQQWEKAARRYENGPSPAVSDFSMMDPINWIERPSEMFPTDDVPFEDITVKLSRGYDTLLRRGYGDYMQVPPPEKRKTHQPYLVELGDFVPEDEA